jgi:hypothetical protein
MIRVIVAVALVACGESARPATVVEIAAMPSASAQADAGVVIEASTIAAPSMTGNALIARTCGPTDGPATTMIISDEILTCDDWSRARKRSYIAIETWGTLGIAEHATINLPTTSGGEVSTCTADGTCEHVSRAALSIDHVNGESFDGTLEVTPKTGARRRVVVHAIRCELHIMCG